MKGYIYKITSPTNKVYIGQTIDIEKRMSYYRTNHCKPQKILYESIKKYGWDKHTMEIITEVETIEELNKLEIEFIEQYKSNKTKYPHSNGMNLSDGGEGNRGPKSQSWKNKMKEKWNDPEYKEKMKNVHESLEWKEICKNRQLGKKLSEETKEKMRNIWLDPNYKNNMKEKLKKPKIKRTEEHCLNLSQSLKGRKFTDEHKNKLSQIKKKIILQMDLEDNIIREWSSISEATKELNIHQISLVCNGKQKTAGGYKWIYKNN